MNLFSNINSIISSNIIQRSQNYTNINRKNILEEKFLQSLTEEVNNQDVQYTKENNCNSPSLNEVDKSNKVVNNNIISNTQNNSLLKIYALMGHNVLIADSKIIHSKDSDIIYGYCLPEDTSFTLINIKDSNNKLVFSHKIHNQKPGDYIYYWNGKVDNENVIGTGIYTISITANNHINSFDIQPLVHGIVDGIEKMPDSDTYIVDLGLMGRTNIENVRRIF